MKAFLFGALLFAAILPAQSPPIDRVIVNGPGGAAHRVKPGSHSRGTLSLLPSMSLDSPLDYQVFQRSTRDSGTILIAGPSPADSGQIDARLSGISTKGPLKPKWISIPFSSKSRSFRAELTAPAGGFYELEIRVRQGRRVFAETTVEHVGVGEVFVIAGQSNATNYGEVPQRTQSGMVSSFSGMQWVIANDPQPGVQDNSRKGSFIPAFGDAMYARFHVPIAVACVGHGSTSVRQWLPKGERFAVPPTMTRFVRPSEPGAPGEWESDGTLFAGMLLRIQQLGPHGFRALLWHQGESDAHQKPANDISGDEYRKMLEQMITASRRQAGWNFPWMVAQVSYHTPDDPACPAIREAQRTLWQTGLALPGPDTDALTGDNRQNNGKGVHFSGKGLAAHGQLWADKVGSYLDRVLR